MRNINFLYEFKTPNGYLPMGYELKDLPIIFNQINESSLEVCGVQSIRCTKDNGPFRIDTDGMDFFYNVLEFSTKDHTFSQVLVKDLTSSQLSNDYNLFVINSLHGELITNFVENVNFDDLFMERSLNIIKQNDNVRIAIIDNKEGSLVYNDTFFKKIREFVNKHNLNYNKIIFITNTSNINKIYLKYLQKYNLESFMVCESCNFYIADDPGRNIIQYEKTTDNYKTEKITERGDDYSLDKFPPTNKRNNYYLCLNRNSGRFHRVNLILELIKHGLFDKGLISLLRSEEFDKWAEKPQNIHYKLYIKDKYPFTIDYEDPQHVSQLHNYFSETRMWNDTYFSIVNETSVMESSIFITEKTIRPMIYFHPFVVYGNPGTLGELHNLGFETFPEMFDESYDTIVDKTERMKAIVKTVSDICKLPKDELHELYHSLYPKLIHNRNTLVNFSKNNYTLTKFLEILNK